MKVVILAGGRGTRISEESDMKPKPMIEIGGKPILWHIMKHYAKYGFNEFIICGGYKVNVIKEYFLHFPLYNGDITFETTGSYCACFGRNRDEWKVTVADTGLETMTGGRIRAIKKYLNNEPFLLTYGDGVADVNLPALISEHYRSKHIATMTAVRPAGRFGYAELCGDSVISFGEKQDNANRWVNGGFFVCQPFVFDYIGDYPGCVFEGEPLEKMAKDGVLGAYQHTGFWKPMDTMRDKVELEALWASGEAPWRTWYE